MLNATKASIYKMFHDKAFLLCIFGTIAWAMIVIMAQVLTSSARGITGISQLANRWHGFIGLHSIEVPLIVSAVILFTSEYRDKSWKLLIAKGISKTSFYFSKLICMFLLTVIISFTSIMTTAVGNVVVLHATFDGAYVTHVLRFFLAQCIAHLSIATLVFTIICNVRRGEIVMIISMFSMIFGYVILSGVERALGIGECITDFWAFSQPAFVEFDGAVQWGRMSVTLLEYLVAGSLITMAVLMRRDVE